MIWVFHKFSIFTENTFAVVLLQGLCTLNALLIFVACENVYRINMLIQMKFISNKSYKYGMTGTYWNLSFKKNWTELFVENNKCLQAIDLDNTPYIVMTLTT